METTNEFDNVKYYAFVKKYSSKLIDENKELNLIALAKMQFVEEDKIYLEKFCNERGYKITDEKEKQFKAIYIKGKTAPQYAEVENNQFEYKSAEVLQTMLVDNPDIARVSFDFINESGMCKKEQLDSVVGDYNCADDYIAHVYNKQGKIGLVVNNLLMEKVFQESKTIIENRLLNAEGKLKFTGFYASVDKCETVAGFYDILDMHNIGYETKMAKVYNFEVKKLKENETVKSYFENKKKKEKVKVDKTDNQQQTIGTIVSAKKVKKPMSKLRKTFVILFSAVGVASALTGGHFLAKSFSEQSGKSAEESANVSKFTKDFNKIVISGARKLADMSNAGYSVNEELTSVERVYVESGTMKVSIHRVDARDNVCQDEINFYLDEIKKNNPKINYVSADYKLGETFIMADFESGFNAFIENSGKGTATMQQQTQCLEQFKAIMQVTTPKDCVINVMSAAQNNTNLNEIAQKTISDFVNDIELTDDEKNAYYANLNATTMFYTVNSSAGFNCSQTLNNTIVLNDDAVISKKFNVSAKGNFDSAKAIEAIKQVYVDGIQSDLYNVVCYDSNYSVLTAGSVNQAFYEIVIENINKYNEAKKAKEAADAELGLDAE